MTRLLSSGEVSKIVDVVEGIVGDGEISALCLYGSQVAGYARKGSDYDVIVVLEKYKPKVRYKYVNGEVDVSALIVDSRSLVLDAERAALGEFVAGRFLNPYVAVKGADFLKTVEVSYKTRVITETLSEIVSNLSDFAYYLLLPLEFFLFEKLRKRAIIYPPALYSYIKNYSDDRKTLNLENSLRGFRDAAMTLQSRGLVEVRDDVLRIPVLVSKSGNLRMPEFIRTTTVGVKQYAVHSYAGRVGWDVFRKEAISKLTRIREDNETPDEIAHPRNLWRLEEGLLIADSEDWLPKLVAHLGLSEEAKVSQEPTDVFYETSKIYTLSDKKRSVKVVVKKFSDLRSFKWIALNVWGALASARFRMSPLSRLAKEYRFLKELREAGFNTPQAIAVVLGERVLVREFIDGIPIGTVVSGALKGEDLVPEPIEAFGETLGRIHSAGYRLGDTKPNNAIFVDGKVYLTDLEQASIGGDKAWDVSEFLYFSAKLTLNAEAVRSIMEAFAKGYAATGSKETLKKASNLKYLAPFSPFLAPNISKIVRDYLSAH